MTLACLTSVFKMSYPSFSIVVVDNGSTDGTPDAVAAKYPSVHLVRNKENLGIVLGRNAGWHYIEKNVPADYILSIDNDTLFETTFLSELMNALQNDSRAGIACGKTYSDRTSQKIMSVGIRANFYIGRIYDIGGGETDRGHYSNKRYVDSCGGFGQLIKREVFEDTDGLDERYNPYGWDDTEFCLRAARFGWKALYVPTAIMYHFGTRAGRKAVGVYEESKAKNYFKILFTYASWPQLAILAFIIPIRALIHAARLLYNGEHLALFSQLRGFLKAVKERR